METDELINFNVDFSKLNTTLKKIMTKIEHYDELFESYGTQISQLQSSVKEKVGVTQMDRRFEEISFVFSLPTQVDRVEEWTNQHEFKIKDMAKELDSTTAQLGEKTRLLEDNVQFLKSRVEQVSSLAQGANEGLNHSLEETMNERKELHDTISLLEKKVNLEDFRVKKLEEELEVAKETLRTVVSLEMFEGSQESHKTHLEFVDNEFRKQMASTNDRFDKVEEKLEEVANQFTSNEDLIQQAKQALENFPTLKLPTSVPTPDKTPISSPKPSIHGDEGEGEIVENVGPEGGTAPVSPIGAGEPSSLEISVDIHGATPAAVTQDARLQWLAEKISVKADKSYCDDLVEHMWKNAITKFADLRTLIREKADKKDINRGNSTPMEKKPLEKSESAFVMTHKCLSCERPASPPRRGESWKRPASATHARDNGKKYIEARERAFNSSAMVDDSDLLSSVSKSVLEDAISVEAKSGSKQSIEVPIDASGEYHLPTKLPSLPMRSHSKVTQRNRIWFDNLVEKRVASAVAKHQISPEKQQKKSLNRPQTLEDKMLALEPVYTPSPEPEEDFLEDDEQMVTEDEGFVAETGAVDEMQHEMQQPSPPATSVEKAVERSSQEFSIWFRKRPQSAQPNLSRSPNQVITPKKRLHLGLPVCNLVPDVGDPQQQQQQQQHQQQRANNGRKNI